MRLCRGCGGVLGRDCFNEQECEWILYSEQQNKEQSRDTEIQQLQYQISQLSSELETLKELLKDKL